MVELIESWLSRVLLWNEREWTEFRHSLPGVIFVPLIFIIPGAFLGHFGQGPKQWVLEAGIALVWYYLARLLWRRAPFSIEVGAVAEFISSKESGGAPKKVGAEAVQAAETYLQLAGAILASELVIGFIAFWTPAHQFPRMAILAFLGIGAIVFYAIWQWSGQWWRRVVFWLAIFTTAAAFFAVFLPQTFAEISDRASRIDRCEVARMRGEKLPIECQPRTPPPPARAAYRVGPTIHWQKVATLTAPAGGEWSKTYRSYDWPPYGYFRVVSFTECATKEPVMAEVLFSDGKFFQLVPCRERDFGNKTGEFRLRSAGKRDVMVSLYKGVVE